MSSSAKALNPMAPIFKPCGISHQLDVYEEMLWYLRDLFEYRDKCHVDESIISELYRDWIYNPPFFGQTDIAITRWTLDEGSQVRDDPFQDNKQACFVIASLVAAMAHEAWTETKQLEARVPDNRVWDNVRVQVLVYDWNELEGQANKVIQDAHRAAEMELAVRNSFLERFDHNAAIH